MMGGLNADGEKARSIGMLIKSNLPDSELGDYGTLKLQWNIVEGDTSPTGFSMEASGGTQLSLGTDEVSLRLALGPNDIVTFDDNEGADAVALATFGTFLLGKACSGSHPTVSRQLSHQF
ncbi:hypothetical protein FOZ61_003689 [Perkinsus olseni]|uniref:Uncharacterized protein n=1 Tax=Perkinsus olseni TaxID=32597 RepID=A0A7J6LNW2_PEROL|nr:hypothetical protein FOZ61_003689 [Perkinsus olseni]